LLRRFSHCYHNSNLAQAATGTGFHLELGNNLIYGRFVERVNRFLALVDIDGREVCVHVANSGRMKELFLPGVRVLVKPAPGEHRKTKFDLALVDLGFTLVSADARLPNTLVAEAIAEGHLSQFSEYSEITREVPFGESRLDLMLNGGTGKCYIETKSVTLVEKGMGLFPDSPTIRGAKHLQSLATAVEAGHRAAVVFVVQRADVSAFATNDPADPLLSETFRWACSSGVEAYAYSCRVTESSVLLDQNLPIVPFARLGGDA